MKKETKTVLILLGLVAVLSLVVFLIFSRPKTGKSGSTKESGKYAAIVAEEKISRADFEKELAYRRNFYMWSKQDFSNLTTLEKDTLESLIDLKLVLDYAQKQQISVSDEELKQRFQAALGITTEEEYLAKILAMYGMDKTGHLEKLKHEIIKEKVQQAVGMPLFEWLNLQKQQVKIERFVN